MGRAWCAGLEQQQKQGLSLNVKESNPGTGQHMQDHLLTCLTFVAAICSRLVVHCFRALRDNGLLGEAGGLMVGCTVCCALPVSQIAAGLLPTACCPFTVLYKQTVPLHRSNPVAQNPDSVHALLCVRSRPYCSLAFVCCL